MSADTSKPEAARTALQWTLHGLALAGLGVLFWFRFLMDPMALDPVGASGIVDGLRPQSSWTLLALGGAALVYLLGYGIWRWSCIWKMNRIETAIVVVWLAIGLGSFFTTGEFPALNWYLALGFTAQIVARVLRWRPRGHEIRLAWRIAMSHLRSRRRERAVSAITLVSVVGVTIGVMALIIVLSVMSGFEIDMRDKILGSNAHIVVLNYGGEISDTEAALTQIEAIDGVHAAAPFVYSEMMLRSEFGQSGVVFKGLDPARTPAVTDLASNLTIGLNGELTTDESKLALLQQLRAPPPADTQDVDDTDVVPGIIVGEELAATLRAYVGDKVHVVNPIGGGTGPMGVPAPKVKTFRIVGIFYSGMYEYDTKWCYVDNADAQEFLGLGDAVSGIEVSADDIYAVGKLSMEIEDRLEYPFYARHWKNLNSKLFSALKLEKIVMGLILSLIVMVASLNIVGTLILVVLTRAREISIFRAMGASAVAVRAVFMLEGLVIGGVGTVVGTALGLAGCWGLDKYQFPLDTDVYYLDSLPVVVVPSAVAFVMYAAVLICFAATLYPASQAAKVDPVEGLRYE